MKSHKQKRRHVSARWHNQMVTWSLGPAADGGSWCGWTRACQQPAHPAEAGAVICSGLTHLERVSLQTQVCTDVACCTTPPEDISEGNVGHNHHYYISKDRASPSSISFVSEPPAVLDVVLNSTLESIGNGINTQNLSKGSSQELDLRLIP